MKCVKKIRVLFFAGGIIILTLGARILLLSGLGVGGLDAIAIGLANIYNMSIGTFIFILGTAILITGSLINKKFRISPIITSIIIGWIYDLWGNVLFEKLTAPQSEAMIGFTFLLGILIAPAGAAIYIVSDISMGPVDYLMWAIKQHSKLSMQTSRILIESCFVVIGWLAGGPIGMGTICIMLFWGPILQVYYNIIVRHVKNSKK